MQFFPVAQSHGVQFSRPSGLFELVEAKPGQDFNDLFSAHLDDPQMPDEPPRAEQPLPQSTQARAFADDSQPDRNHGEAASPVSHSADNQGASSRADVAGRKDERPREGSAEPAKDAGQRQDAARSEQSKSSHKVASKEERPASDGMNAAADVELSDEALVAEVREFLDILAADASKRKGGPDAAVLSPRIEALHELLRQFKDAPPASRSELAVTLGEQLRALHAELTAGSRAEGFGDSRGKSGRASRVISPVEQRAHALLHKLEARTTAGREVASEQARSVPSGSSVAFGPAALKDDQGGRPRQVGVSAAAIGVVAAKVVDNSARKHGEGADTEASGVRKEGRGQARNDAPVSSAAAGPATVKDDQGGQPRQVGVSAAAIGVVEGKVVDNSARKHGEGADTGASGVRKDGRGQARNDAPVSSAAAGPATVKDDQGGRPRQVGVSAAAIGVVEGKVVDNSARKHGEGADAGASGVRKEGRGQARSVASGSSVAFGPAALKDDQGGRPRQVGGSAAAIGVVEGKVVDNSARKHGEGADAGASGVRKEGRGQAVAARAASREQQAADASQSRLEFRGAGLEASSEKSSQAAAGLDNSALPADHVRKSVATDVDQAQVRGKGQEGSTRNEAATHAGIAAAANRPAVVRDASAQTLQQTDHLRQDGPVGASEKARSADSKGAKNQPDARQSFFGEPEREKTASRAAQAAGNGKNVPESMTQTSAQNVQTQFQQRLESPVSARSAHVYQQVENGAFKNLGQGVKQLVIRLDPADLGQVSVILQVRGKEVQAVLRSSNQETSLALNEQLGQLRSQLEAQGLKVGKLEVQTQLADSQSQSQWQGAESHNRYQENQELAMSAKRWRTLERAAPGLVRDVQNSPHRENLSQSGLDIFA